ncbi:NAD(P)H-binding protein [Nocardia sp. CS682]|uniref:NAD(P)H-binding protein n=1 Tax=Nocardia sp. CS682 TaxID=1047172 RepID=UPI00107585DF|nr:NAD(P)H-binding protein [Nocardia sp. CS682]QBS46284.1 hydroxylase [Nocardia sp. CS682]
MKILVTGATGNIGRMVVDHLLAAGAQDIRALSNHPERTNFPAGVEVVKGYLKRVSSLPAAFEGVDRMYLAPVLETIDEVVAAAKAAGIRHIVDLSGNEYTDWQPIARAVENSGLDWTHLYAGEFTENATIWTDQIRAGDVLPDAYPEAANAPLVMDDIARVAAAVLLSDGHAGKVYELTGPETLTRAEKITQLGAALGRPLRMVKVSREEAIQQLTPAMGEYAEWYVDGLATMVEHPQQANTIIADLTGAPATTFAQWAAANTALFQ